MTSLGTYHLPKGTSADGPYDLAITPESAGWAYSGLRTLTLRPGEEHALSTGENEFLVLPLNGGCTVAVDGRSFELGGRTDVFSAVTDFAYLPRESQAVISSAQGSLFALPCARTEQKGHSARYGRKEDVPVEPRGAGACSLQVNNYCLPGTFDAERLLVCEVLTPGGNWSSYPPHKNGFGCLRVPPRERSRAWGRVYGTDEQPMAGPGQDRAWLICDDPAPSRVRDTWQAQFVDDRLPFEGSRQR
ncbi:5-deoxy-glucuronate isomerase [Streptomyces canus]|uniref:5-deoxy-glucuronate isomerase n=1 Tax=Streptomyces canus TaxID=58343 RepID=UPI002E2ACDDB|nr:5-deoxy-glucuronate isomerase [Streptomyces canus]